MRATRPGLLLLLLLLLGAPAPRARAGEPAAEGDVRVGRIQLAADGVYRIRAAQLVRLGIPSVAHADLRRRGQAVPLRRSPEGHGDLLFLADGTATDHSKWAVYEVLRRAQPAAPDPAPPAGGAPGWEVSRRLDTDRVLGALAAADPAVYDPPGHAATGLPVWFLGMAPPRQSFPVDLGPLGAKAGAPQVLLATVYANWAGPVVMTARWGEHDLGSAGAPSAVGGTVLRWQVPADAVPTAEARLVLANASPPPPPPPPRDVSALRGTLWVDGLRLEGEGRWVLPFADAQPVEVEPAGPPRDPLAAATTARHVILAVPALLEGARTLAAHRSAHGLPSAVVPVLDVYDRYTHGEHDPSAIRRFLADLAARPGAPLDYVLLAGDATYDRTDLVPLPTIPAPVTRSMYNGATASDALYLPAGGAASIGRLPFREATQMEAYVERLVRYELQPPADATRRMLRFVTSEGRFSPFIDGLIENRFRNVLAGQVPLAYDVEVTYANPRSPFLWPPPEMAAKVVEGLNEGALVYTYVGHGFEKGFDTLQVGGQAYRILHAADAARVDVRGTPPVVFVLACTTGMFDGVRGDGIGEALLKRPHGPVAYWGASRICHPVYNAFVGEAIARDLGSPGAERLGDLLGRARAEARGLMDWGTQRLLQLFLQGLDLEALFTEGGLMYGLLGDPALRIAFPREDLAVEARAGEDRTVHAAVSAGLPDGTELEVSLELPRNRDHFVPEPVADPSHPASFETIRRNHARVNDRALARTRVRLADGAAAVDLALPEGVEARGLVVKAWCIAAGDVHQGAVKLR